MLHLAATTAIGLQASVRAMRRHALRRLTMNFGQCCFFKGVFFAIDLRRNHFKWQCAVYKDHLAIAVRYALGFEI
jgi:hypothetical protein